MSLQIDISQFHRNGTTNDPKPNGNDDGFAEHFNYECYNLYNLTVNVPQKINDKVYVHYMLKILKHILLIMVMPMP